MIKKISIFAICVLAVFMTCCNGEPIGDQTKFELTLNNQSNFDYHLWIPDNENIGPGNKLLPGASRVVKVVVVHVPNMFIWVRGGQNGISETFIEIPLTINSKTKIGVYFDGQYLTYEFLD